MKLEEFENIYLIGIGGIGMSALARWFRMRGKKVLGYDRTPSQMTDKLVKEGIEAHFDDDITMIPSEVLSKDKTLVIFTPAVPQEHRELQWFREKGFTVKKRSEVLGNITGEYFTIAVAGTHGKTTTSSIVAHILKQSSADCTAFLGGIARNYQSNLLVSTTSRNLVVEADEFDRSFLHLSPDIALITSIDADHLDVYGNAVNMESTYMEFAARLKEDGTLIYKAGLPFDKVKHRSFTYSLKEKADFKASNINISQGEYHFDVMSPVENIREIRFSYPGLHNVENAVAATAIAQTIGVSEDEIRSGLSSFKGVKRRFDYHIKKNNLIYIDDYAHHPAELKASIKAVRALYPEKKITGIFQPHLYTRTRDFADEFARSLELLDELILLEIYPAREKPIPGIDSAMLMEKVQLENKHLMGKEELLRKLEDESLEVLMTLGAGDIDQLVEPIKLKLLKSGKGQSKAR